MSATPLAQLVDALDRGALTIVDLTQPLGPATPVFGLPSLFAASLGVTIDVISQYDDKGPAWYGCGPGGDVRPAVSEPHDHARQRQPAPGHSDHTRVVRIAD